MSKKKIVVFTGAGMSAESGIKTFRATDGLWENYKIEEVATPTAWEKNKELVLDFYNQRRKQIIDAKPNEAHAIIAKLQEQFDVYIITQNIDNLHERAGSKQVLHLHGEIMKGRSTKNPNLIMQLQQAEIHSGDLCELGSQIRPHIVWFGEAVPEMDNAIEIAKQADIFITIGTSLNVYPAANLIHVIEPEIPKFLIDPGDFNLDYIKNLTIIKSNAVAGIKVLVDKLQQYI